MESSSRAPGVFALGFGLANVLLQREGWSATHVKRALETFVEGPTVDAAYAELRPVVTASGILWLLSSDGQNFVMGAMRKDAEFALQCVDKAMKLVTVRDELILTALRDDSQKEWALNAVVTLERASHHKYVALRCIVAEHLVYDVVHFVFQHPSVNTELHGRIKTLVFHMLFDEDRTVFEAVSRSIFILDDEEMLAFLLWPEFSTVLHEWLELGWESKSNTVLLNFVGFVFRALDKFDDREECDKVLASISPAMDCLWEQLRATINDYLLAVVVAEEVLGLFQIESAQRYFAKSDTVFKEAMKTLRVLEGHAQIISTLLRPSLLLIAASWLSLKGCELSKKYLLNQDLNQGPAEDRRQFTAAVIALTVPQSEREESLFSEIWSTLCFGLNKYGINFYNEFCPKAHELVTAKLRSSSELLRLSTLYAWKRVMGNIDADDPYGRMKLIAKNSLNEQQKKWRDYAVTQLVPVVMEMVLNGTTVIQATAFLTMNSLLSTSEAAQQFFASSRHRKLFVSPLPDEVAEARHKFVRTAVALHRRIIIRNANETYFSSLEKMSFLGAMYVDDRQRAEARIGTRGS